MTSARPLVFATRNHGKLVELRALLSGCDVLSIDDAARRLGRPIPDVVEDADTFAGNAIKKAREVSRVTGLPALADATGPLGTEVLTADGTCEGVILDAPRGSGGFGYDPLFFAPELGQTFAEAGVGPKSDLSHRARAMKAIKPRLLAYLEQLARP